MREDHQREQENQRKEYNQLPTSMFQSSEDPNLIQWQLQLDDILERIDHLLRGHEIKFSSDGTLKWAEPKDKNKKLFNEYGVQEILRILSMYLNRNTILSNYDEETINWKVYDLGIEISDLIYMKYEDMGLDTPEKIKLYMITVREIIDTIHSTYLRALNGGERESLKTARHIIQNQNMNPEQEYAETQKSKKFSLKNPTTWF